MKALYKSSRLIAAAIVGTLVLSAGAAIAVTKDATNCEPCPASQSMTQAEDMGRFVVTPKTVTYVRPDEDLGRFVVSQHSATYVPAA